MIPIFLNNFPTYYEVQIFSKDTPRQIKLNNDLINMFIWPWWYHIGEQSVTKTMKSFVASFYEGPLDLFKFQLHNVRKNLDLKGDIMYVPFPSLIIGWGD